MKITDLLSKDAIKLNGIANSKQDAINKLVDLMAKNGKSTINVDTSTDNIGDGFQLTGKWRQYSL